MSDGGVSDDAFLAWALDASRPLTMFGCVPPPNSTPMAVRDRAVQTAAATIARLPVDAYVPSSDCFDFWIEPKPATTIALTASPRRSFVVYDVQDEQGRDGTARPFPFTPAHDHRAFCADLGAALRAQHARRDVASLLYSAACDTPPEALQAWLHGAAAGASSARWSLTRRV